LHLIDKTELQHQIDYKIK